MRHSNPQHDAETARVADGSWASLFESARNDDATSTVSD
mgnify:CR=1 FL=1